MLSIGDHCKDTEKASEKGDTDSSLAKTEDKENKPGTHAMLSFNKTGIKCTITVLLLESKANV